MTKRIKSSALIKARKETKRLQREARTRIRKAKKYAQESGDTKELKKLSELEKRNSRSLKSVGKSGLPKSYTHNVKWEKGRALNLKELNSSTLLNKKKKARVTRRTFENLFGKEKTTGYLNTIGGREMTRMSNKFWDQMYEAQDMLFSMGIVPADEIMGRWGSIGSGLLNVGTKLVNDGYWSSIKIDIDSKNNGTWVVMSEQDDRVTESDLASAIVTRYKQQYGLE